MKTIFISAGDPSGDIHAAKLMHEIKNIDSDIRFIGIGGSNMISQGLDSIVDFSKMNVVGFWEVAKNYSFFYKTMNHCKKIISDSKIDCFIPVDYPGFNISLAGFCKSKSIPVYYYIAPQLWVWGKNRANKLKNCVDKLLVVFPFEVDFFKNYNIDAEFVGHPLLDDSTFHVPILDYDNRDKKIVFLPGSRKQEIIRHIPLIKHTIDLLKKELKGFDYIIAKSHSLDKNFYDYYIKENKSLKLEENSKELMQHSLTGLVKTGTSNLEAALCGMPFVMFYHTSMITYFMGKNLINLPYISIINILENKPIIKECIQKDANPINLSNSIIEIIKNKVIYNSLQNSLKDIKLKLGNSGSSKNAASIIMNNLNK